MVARLARGPGPKLRRARRRLLMPRAVSRGVQLLPARIAGAARPPCPGGPRLPPVLLALRRFSGRLAASRRESPRASASSTSLPDVSSSLPDVLSSLPGVLSTPSWGSPAVVLGWQPLWPQARCLRVYRLRCALRWAAAVAVGPFGAGWAAFFVCWCAWAKRRGFAAAAGPPGVGLGLVRHDRRLVES